MPSNRLEVLITGSAADFNRTLGEVQSKSEKAFGEIEGMAQKASLALGALAASGGLLISSFVSKASEMEGFGTTLERVMGSAEAGQAELKRLADFAANTPFELPGVVQAGITLRALGVDAQKFLPLAGDLASVFRKDITEGALALGKALSGSQDGIQMLADTYGISRQKMIEFGAAAKADGSIAVESASDIEKLQGALEKIVSGNYGGAMEAQARTMAGVLSNTADQIGQFSAEIGQELLPTLKSASEFVGGLVASFREMDPATKGMLGDTLLVGTAVAGVGAAITGLISILGPAAAAYVFLQQTTRAAAAAQAEKAAKAQAAAALEAKNALATQAAAAAQVEEALALQATTVSEGEAAVAAELLAAAEAELATAAEAAAVAEGNLAAANTVAAASSGTAAAATGGMSAMMAAIPFGPVVIGIGLVAAALALAISEYSKSTVALEEQVKAGEKGIRMWHRQKDVILATADALREFDGANQRSTDALVEALKKKGKTDLDVTQAIAGNMQRLKDLREQELRVRTGMESGDRKAIAEQIKKLEERNEVLRKARVELSGTYAVQERLRNENAAKEKKAESDRLATLEDYKKKASAGYYATAKEQMAALDQVLRTAKKTDKDFQDLTYDRIKLARKVAEDEAKTAEEGRKKTIDGELHKLDLIVGADEDHIKRRLALLDELLRRTDLNLQERQRLEVDQKREEDSLNRARAESAKKAEEAKKKAAEETAAAKQKLRAAELSAAEEELTAAREAFKRGSMTLQQLEEQIKLRDQLAAKVNLEKAAQEGAGKSESARAQMRKTAIKENETAEKKSAREVEELRRESARQRAKEAETDAQIKTEQAKAEEDSLKQQLEAGGKVGDKLLNQVKERQKAETEALLQKASAQRLDASAAEQAQIDKQLQLDLLQLKRSQKAEIREITEELKRQKDAQKKNDGFTLGGMSADANDFSAFDLTTGKDQGKDQADKLKALQRDESAAQAEAQSAVGGDGKETASETKSDRPEKGAKEGKSDSKDPTPAGAGADQAGRVFEEILAKLEAVNSNLITLVRICDKPLVATLKQGAANLGTDRPDWRLSTNKQEGAF